VTSIVNLGPELPCADALGNCKADETRTMMSKEQVNCDTAISAGVLLEIE
jgi:hypothetical protein